MNNPNQPAIRLSTQSDQYSVSPGDKIEIPLVLTNVGAVADQARISIEGIPLIWVTAEQQVILLQPGEQRQVILTIQPPAPPTPEPALHRTLTSSAYTNGSFLFFRGSIPSPIHSIFFAKQIRKEKTACRKRRLL